MNNDAHWSIRRCYGPWCFTFVRVTFRSVSRIAVFAAVLAFAAACGNGPMFGDYTPPTLPPMPTGASGSPQTSGEPAETTRSAADVAVAKPRRMGQCLDMVSVEQASAVLGAPVDARQGCVFHFESGKVTGSLELASKKEDVLERVLVGDFEKDEHEGNTVLTGKLSEQSCNVAIVLDSGENPTWLIARGIVYNGSPDSCKMPREILEIAFSNLQEA